MQYIGVRSDEIVALCGQAKCIEERSQECGKIRDEKPCHTRTVKLSKGDPAIYEVLAERVQLYIPSVCQFYNELPKLQL